MTALSQALQRMLDLATSQARAGHRGALGAARRLAKLQRLTATDPAVARGALLALLAAGALAHPLRRSAAKRQANLDHRPPVKLTDAELLAAARRGGSQEALARRLGVSRKTIGRRLKYLGHTDRNVPTDA